MKHLHEERQEYQAQAEGDDISHREPEEFSDHPFAFYVRFEGDIFMKNIGVGDRNEIARDHSRHICDVPGFKKPGKYGIE